TLRKALILAEASHDDHAAAQAAIGLTYVVGFRLGREKDADFLGDLAEALLDRIGGQHGADRAWLFENLATVRVRAGNLEEARALLEKSLRLKEQVLRRSHP